MRDDPFKPGRNGLKGIEQVVEIHSPLELVILILGTNDFQSVHPHNAWHVPQGISALISAIRQSPLEPGMPIPEILLVAPPPIQEPEGPPAPKFQGGEAKCAGLADEYQAASREMGCYFFDSATVTSSSEVDGIHLDKEQHHILGMVIAGKVAQILA